jgi:hypothetical protein
MAYYTSRIANGRYVDYLRFERRADRNRWVNSGWGRVEMERENFPGGQPGAVDWSPETIYFADGTEVEAQSAPASSMNREASL